MQPTGSPTGFQVSPGWSPPGVPRPEGSWRSPGYRAAGTRAQFAIFLLAVSAVVAAVTAVLAGILVVQLTDFRAGSARGSDVAQTLDLLDAAYGLAALLVLPTAFAFLAWLSRSVDNAPPLGAGTPETSPAASIGWWFVPFANLVMPYRIVRDLLDRLAVPWLQPGRVAVLSWWLLFIIGYLLRSTATAATRLQTRTLDELVDRTTAAGVLAALGSVLLVSSAVEGIRIVREIQKRAEFREAYLGRAAPGPWAQAGMPGAYGAPVSAPYPAPAGPPLTPPFAVAPPAASSVAGFCPRCGIRRATPDRYCAACGYDFALVGGLSAPPPGPAAPSVPVVSPVPVPEPPVATPAASTPPASQPPTPAAPPAPQPPPDLSPAELVAWSGRRIFELDALLDRLYEQGKSPLDADNELTAIGKRLHAAGGENLMREALVQAQSYGMRGRYVERHWTGIGSWMG
jgi:hypothetical protein